MAKRKVNYICEVVRWFDAVNGNTYYSCQITRCSDGAKLYCEFRYGYGEAYKPTALKAMTDNGWITVKVYRDIWLYERDNGYPIYWIVRDGSKRHCIAHGKPI